MTTITADYFRSSGLTSRSLSASQNRYIQPANGRIAPVPASSLQARVSAELAVIARDCAKENWDGYGAAAISPETLARVFRFLEDLPPWIPAPDLVPESDSEIAIEWYFAENYTFSVSVPEFGPLHYAGLFGVDEEIHGVAPYNENIPEKILGFITELFRSPAACASK